jgi:hypothetical protein
MVLLDDSRHALFNLKLATLEMSDNTLLFVDCIHAQSFVVSFAVSEFKIVLDGKSELTIILTGIVF